MTETARELLHRHGLPEDVLDGALTLHAQELAAPPADEGLRDRLRRAICEADGFDWDPDMLEPDEYGGHADAVLAVHPAPADRVAEVAHLRSEIDRLAAWLIANTGEPRDSYSAVDAAINEMTRLHADRATGLREAADVIVAEQQRRDDEDSERVIGESVVAATIERGGVNRAAKHLRRMAVEAQQAERPSCPDPIECSHEAALGLAEAKLDAIHGAATAWARPDMSEPSRIAGTHLLRILDADEAQQAESARRTPLPGVLLCGTDCLCRRTADDAQQGDRP